MESESAELLVKDGLGTGGPVHIVAAAQYGGLSIIGWVGAMWLVAWGAGLQGYANGTLDAILVALLYLIVGLAVVAVIFRRGRLEQRAFVMAYAACVVVGGLAQTYSLAVFGEPQSTTDAFAYFRLLSPQQSFDAGFALPLSINAPLAVLIWQKLSEVAWHLGFGFGPHVVVMFNAVVIGLAGSFTVRITRELFGDDIWRLRRVGTLFAFCGLFLLLGAILLRDSFTTLVNVVMLWGLVRWLVKPNVKTLVFALVITGFSIWAMLFLRVEAVVLFATYWSVAIVFWFLRRRIDGTRILAVMLILVSIVVAGSYASNFVNDALTLRSVQEMSYAAHSAAHNPDESLGMRLIVNQPLPTRLVLGTGFLMVYPIPLWAGVEVGAMEYNLIMGYHGFYMLVVMPLILVGLLFAVIQILRGHRPSMPLGFLALYFIVGLASVVVTSLETRHVAQFLPALIILAAVPDTRLRRVKGQVTLAGGFWATLVVLVHVAWAIARVL